MSTGIVYVCDECESDRVVAAASAVWNVEKQDWVLDDVEDHSDYCMDCEDQRSLITRKVHLKDIAKVVIKREEANVRAG
jgi:hypothetical protein